MMHHDASEPISPYILSHIRVISSLSILALPHLLSLPVIRTLVRPVGHLVADFLPIKDFVSPDPPTTEEKQAIRAHGPRLWRQIVLVLAGLIEAVAWLAVWGITITRAAEGAESVVDVLGALGMAVVWLYLFIKPLFRPPSTPPWAEALVYTILWVISLADISLALFLYSSNSHWPAWASTSWLAFEIANFAITSLLVYVVGGLPLASPEVFARVQTSPDDRVTLFSWLSFSWIDSFIRFGNTKELEPEDLPDLSPTMQTAYLFERFSQLKGSSLLRKMLWANKLDLGLDATLTLVSVVLNYASPFFLKRILDGLTNRSPRAMSQAYAYALLAFLATALKAITELLHLWHSRRCAVRLKAELTAAVYDKALRRKDASGIVAEKEEEEKDDDKKDGKDKGKKEDKKEKKTNADSGKIVNLMAGDANRISNVVAGLYFIYSAPLEIIVASLFLYNILGWAAFAGVVVLIIAVPLNSFVSKRSIAITQDLLKARDKRISVMTELIGAITFIKFFAWGQQWKKRAAEARALEMKQMIRSLINGIFFSMLWALAPLLVTLASFFCYIVIMKRDLTVSVAFTAISLFSMLRLPLNVIPTFAVWILQAHVSVKRIEDFLGEDEVPDWVCSLKRSSDPFLGKPKIGFEAATLQWNTGKQTGSPASAATVNGSSSTSDSDTLVPPADAAPRFQLSNLSVQFPLGKLSIITGPTGSGKTAMLTALLGEMELLHGKSYLPKYPEQVNNQGLRNSIAYASQTPWLQQKSIRENILFGEKMDEERYEEVLEACALNPDLDMLEDGDGTEIGAKGVSLSGGQKARVALARAIYSYTQHVLLDDPLAAVDSHTAKHLVDKCLNGRILAGRTILLVSHHVELLLPSAKYVIRILDGRIDAQGTPDDLRARGDLDGLVALEEAEVTKIEKAVVNEEVDDEVLAVDGDKRTNGDAAEDANAESDGTKKRERKKGPGKKFVQDEERPVGNVKWETYKLYIVAATYTTWAWSVVVLVLSQVFAVGERFWLKIWGEAYTVQSQNILSFVQPHVHLSALHPDYHHASSYQHVLHVAANETVGVNTASVPFGVQLPSADDNPGFYLAVYAAVVLGTAFMGVFSNAIGSWGQYRAAVNLHNKLLDTVMNGTIRFFNVTPVGRILNRFSKDVETIDTSLNSGLRTVIVYIASLFGAIAVVAAIVPWFLIPAAIISWMYWQYSVLYLRVGRSLRRLEATSRSPIFSGFAEVLDGIISVRAFSAESRFMATLCKQVDKTHSPHYLFWCMNRWLLLRFDLLGSVSVLLTTLFALSGAIPAGSAGMAILSAQSFVSACYWVSRFWGTLEMDFNSVERVQEYLSIPQEPPATIESNRPPAYWPSSDAGDAFIDVQDLEIKYAPDLPTVFKGSFSIRAGEKIGLIGRTGSGKSTLAMSFLRFCEPFGGKIFIDGIDITSIGVDDLRGAITYIPQDAVLFSGTVRQNLDPFNEHTDEALYDALSRVNLGDTPAPSAGPSRQPSSRRLAEIAAEHASLTVDQASSSASSFKKSNITLTTEVSAGGTNFSQGQRQLVAMARALLRRSNLIIMDEATASVDFATDEAIQHAIRAEFKSSTLLTIAHRLSSVIDYDRLLVLSDGRVAEFDTPINLLRKDDSLFKNLCEKSGKYKELFKAAEKKEKGDMLVDVSEQ